MVRLSKFSAEESPKPSVPSQTQDADSKLAVEAKTDPAAEVKLWENFQALFHSIAKSFLWPGTNRSRIPSLPEYSDLISEQLIPFRKAIQDFDPTKGTKFITVLYKYLEQYLQNTLNSDLAKKRTTRDKYNVVNEVLNEISSSLGAKEKRIFNILTTGRFSMHKSPDGEEIVEVSQDKINFGQLAQDLDLSLGEISDLLKNKIYPVVKRVTELHGEKPRNMIMQQEQNIRSSIRKYFDSLISQDLTVFEAPKLKIYDEPSGEYREIRHSGPSSVDAPESSKETETTKLNILDKVKEDLSQMPEVQVEKAHWEENYETLIKKIEKELPSDIDKRIFGLMLDVNPDTGENYSMQEIAAILGMGTSAVSNHLGRSIYPIVEHFTGKEVPWYRGKKKPKYHPELKKVII